jgi:hypothetical protein
MHGFGRGSTRQLLASEGVIRRFHQVGPNRAVNRSNPLRTRRGPRFLLLSLLLVLTSLDISGGTGAAFATGTGAGSSGIDCSPLTYPTATDDGALDHLFSTQLGPGWVGGDATYSTALPGGREAFVFSDTLIGTANAGGSARINGLAPNSELFGPMPHLRSGYGGTFRSPKPLIVDASGHGDEWQVASTYVENGKQLVFVNEFAPQNGPFDRFTGRSGIAVLAPRPGGPPLLQSIIGLAGGRRTQWGNAVTHDGSFTYIYDEVTSAPNGGFSGMKLARAPLGHSLGTRGWQYWDGSQWEAGEVHAVVIPTRNELTGVMPQEGHAGYEAVSIPGSEATDTTVDLSFACAPQGPWSGPIAVYSIPQIKRFHHELAYIPTFHPELSPSDAVVVSYNVDTTDGLSATRRDVHTYQPRFLELEDKAPPTSTTTTVLVTNVDRG